MDKAELRRHMWLQKRQMLEADILQKSEQLFRLFTATQSYQNAKSLYGYMSYNQEVRTLPILEQALRDGKRVAIPKCCGKEMRFILVQDLSRIQHSPFGVPEPVADGPVATDKTGLVIVPGLVFDRRGYRVGYGGGYYDRFLCLEPDHPTIGLCYDFQLMDRLEPDPYDIAVDTVFSI